MTCLQERGRPNGIISRISFRDDGKYEATCPYGHTTTTILQQQKFEILFEIGAHALIDGYYRESISSFSSSLERFYEFSVRALLFNSQKSDDAFKSCWKHVARQSERQLGAFIMLWASYFGSPPALLSNNLISFRNDVIHKGTIPSKQEAISFGTSTLNALQENIHILQQTAPAAVSKMISYHVQEIWRSCPNHPKSTMFSNTIISLGANNAPSERSDLSHHLKALKQWRELFNPTDLSVPEQLHREENP